MCLAASVAGTLTSSPSATHLQCQCPVRQRLDGGNIPAEGAVAVHGFRQPTPGPRREESGITSPDCSESQPGPPHRITGRSISAIRSRGKGPGGRTIPLGVYSEGIAAGVEPGQAPPLFDGDVDAIRRTQVSVRPSDPWQLLEPAGQGIEVDSEDVVSRPQSAGGKNVRSREGAESANLEGGEPQTPRFAELDPDPCCGAGDDRSDCGDEQPATAPAAPLRCG